jgi:hypothetical protein
MPVRDYQMKWCMTEEDLKTRFQEVVHDPAVDASTYYSGNRLKAENHAFPSERHWPDQPLLQVVGEVH